jgi:hypothetical protein
MNPPKKEGVKEESSNKGTKCHHCNDWGHIRSDYPSFKAWLAKKGIPWHADLKKERCLKLADGHEAKVEVIGSVTLVLHDDFTLMLNNILYVLSLQRNLISLALLEDDEFKCLFGNNKCIIKFDNKVVDLAPRQGILYMLSLNDFPMMNVCDVTNKRKEIILAIMRLL